MKNQCFFSGILCLVFAGLFLLSWSITAFANPPCDRSLNPESGDFGYGPRSEDRCEGFYGDNINISGKIDIIGAIQGKLQFDFNNLDPVVIEVPDLPAPYSNPLQIRAVGIHPETYYRMDGRPARGRFLWPIHEILQPAGLSCEQVSVLAWTMYKSQPLLVPVIVRQGSIGGLDSRVALIVRTNIRLEKLQYRAAPSGESPTGEYRYIDAITQIVWSGTGIPLFLPEGKPKVLMVEIIAKPANSNKWMEPISISVFRVGRK